MPTQKEAPDYVFKCRKCGHLVYCDKENIGKMLKKDCPNCGEENDVLWVLYGEGDYDKEYK